MSNIHINQLGYRPEDKKLAVVTGTYSSFQVIDEATGKAVVDGSLTGGLKDEATLDTVTYADFSQLKTPGNYHIYVPELGQSLGFSICDAVYNEAKNALLKAFYLQRCGTALDKAYADKWHHGVCHDGEAHLYGNESVKLDVTGGWHDAGDYGRYVVPAGKAVADLLLAYEYFPKAFDETINIPESSNNLPDILNEAKYEIDWLFKMQDKTSGGAYHKVATQWFPGMIMPEDDKSPLVLYAISSPATADFAATMALAARVYESFDKNFAQKCLLAAEKAWEWLTKNPAVLFKNPKDAGSGEYGDSSDLDERYWAAAELYRTTGKPEYHEFFKAAFKDLTDITSLGWGDMGGYGSIAYLFTESSRVDSSVYAQIKEKFISYARELVATSVNDGYKVTLKQQGYIWGSNMVVLDNAMHLIIADMLQPDKTFIETALDQWNYIFGVNSLDISYVTGCGAQAVMHPHHRPSEADGVTEPVPGLVSGGPCRGLQDPAAKRDCTGNPPAKCFTDDMGSYSTNEITIYWNSPAVFVAGYLNKK